MERTDAGNLVLHMLQVSTEQGLSLEVTSGLRGNSHACICAIGADPSLIVEEKVTTPSCSSVVDLEAKELKQVLASAGHLRFHSSYHNLTCSLGRSDSGATLSLHVFDFFATGMKFGETFAQRSVGEWAAFNLNYNGVKDVIKNRTSTVLAGPVDIPQHGKSRWDETDKCLLELLRNQYDNINLFLRMKQGEIDRRLVSLTRQIAFLRTHVDEKAPELDGLAGVRGRKHRKLTKESEEVGDLIQKVARFASAQKIAFRKIIKKYTKWTGSTALQTRMDGEVFTYDPLRTDYSDQLQELAEQRTILIKELGTPILRGQQVEQIARPHQLNKGFAKATESVISQINTSIEHYPPAFDAAIMTIPYGEFAGSAVYWIHPDNLDEARALVHRHMKRNRSVVSTPTRTDSDNSIRSPMSGSASNPSGNIIHMAFFDNAQRFAQDKSSARPSKVALAAYWTCDKTAAVTLAGLSPASSGERTILLARDDLSVGLERNARPKICSKDTNAIQQYLIEQRDVKPLSEVRACRTRYHGMTNTTDVATWATLDTSITIGAVDMQQLGRIQRPTRPDCTFPYAVLHIRWEFARMAALVRAVDESHLAYRVNEFSIEDMAIRTLQNGLARATWQILLNKDITKLPLQNPSAAPSLNRRKTMNRIRVHASDLSGTTSGPSSSEGQDSVFSTATQDNTSVTSEDTCAGISFDFPAELKISPADAKASPTDFKTSPTESDPLLSKKARKKRVRVVVPQPDPALIRYWNEFDDGDSDVNPRDSYAIYCDPNEPAFPAMSQAWASIKTWWPLRSLIAEHQAANERTPLLYDGETGSIDSSDSDSVINVQPEQQLRRGLIWGLTGGISLAVAVGLAILIFCIVQLA